VPLADGNGGRRLRRDCFDCRAGPAVKGSSKQVDLGREALPIPLVEAPIRRPAAPFLKTGSGSAGRHRRAGLRQLRELARWPCRHQGLGGNHQPWSRPLPWSKRSHSAGQQAGGCPDGGPAPSTLHWLSASSKFPIDEARQKRGWGRREVRGGLRLVPQIPALLEENDSPTHLLSDAKA